VAVLTGAPPAGVRRLVWLDVARGVAIVAMVAYHLSFDLYFFGFVDWPVTSNPVWRAFAAWIASTFVFLVGVSLVVAHGRGIRWRPFLRRLAILVAAAAAVTVGTLLAMPAPITFGILHAIATFSVLALPFLFAPGPVTLAAAAAVFALPALWRSEVFAHPLLVPFGLAPVPPVTFDYEPIFPWFGLTLLGVAVARAMRLPEGSTADVAPGVLAWAGRHSLVIYLLHQPVLFALLMAAARLRA
jgi:uncharacterized membrane protein